MILNYYLIILCHLIMMRRCGALECFIYSMCVCIYRHTYMKTLGLMYFIFIPSFFLSLFICRYAFPGLVTVTSHLCGTQRNRLREHAKSLAVPAVIVVLHAVAVLLAWFRSCGFFRCVLFGDAPSTYASSL